MYRQPGGQDEDCYAVPGWTFLKEGIPRLPHIPARNPESVFYRAEEAIYCEPPFYFCFQSLFYALFPVCYGTARLSSTVPVFWLPSRVSICIVKGKGRRSPGFGALVFFCSPDVSIFLQRARGLTSSVRLSDCFR